MPSSGWDRRPFQTAPFCCVSFVTVFVVVVVVDIGSGSYSDEVVVLNLFFVDVGSGSTYVRLGQGRLDCG